MRAPFVLLIHVNPIPAFVAHTEPVVCQVGEPQEWT